MGYKESRHYFQRMLRDILRYCLCLAFSLSFVYRGYPQTVSDIKTLLSGEGKVFFGNEPNSILVIDYPANIKRIGEYLKMVDVPPKQVLIEARIVEVKLEGENSLGINWSAFADKGGYRLGQYRIGGETATSAISQSIPYKSTNYPPGSTSAENPFTLTIFDENINIVLKMLANSYNTDILSAPRITTVNNHKAEIKVIKKLPWAEPEVDVLDQGGVSVSWTVKFEEVGITLEVTPMITEDGQISMELKPEVSEKISDYHLTVVQGSTEVPYTVPIIDTRSADTKVVVGNGQTLIIGGLIKEKNIKGTTKVPLLGNIPGLGWLFKSKKDTKDKTELLIFVSPTIITPKVLVNMERKEKLGVGKWYMDERRKSQEVLLAGKSGSFKKEFNTRYNHLRNMYNSLRKERKELKSMIDKEKIGRSR